MLLGDGTCQVHGKIDPHPNAALLSLSLCTSNTPWVCPELLESLPRKSAILSQMPAASWFICRIEAWQGGATGSWEGGANAFFQADVIWRGSLNPEGKASICRKHGRGTQHKDLDGCLSSPSPQSHTTQSVPVQIQSTLSHCLSARVQGECPPPKFCSPA